MSRGRKVWIGGVGIGVDLVCVAAAALGAPAPVWVLAFLAGSGLIAYAFAVGEPDAPVSNPSVQVSDAGSGDGDVRGNVFGDYATISIGQSAQVTASPESKTLVRISLKDLFKIYGDHTEVQAEKLVEPYIGGWMELDATVQDVSMRDYGPKTHHVTTFVDEVLVFLDFPEHLQEHLPRLRRGEVISVVGRISKVNSLCIWFEDCEFAD